MSDAETSPGTELHALRERPAIANLGVELSYGELDRLSRDFGAFLRSELRLETGDRVAIMLPNVLQYPVALFGALRAGLTVVNVNPLSTSELGRISSPIRAPGRSSCSRTSRAPSSRRSTGASSNT